MKNKINKWKMPRQYSLVKFNYDNVPIELHKDYPFKKTNTYIFFGDIPNMPGHCIVIDFKTGNIFSGFHTDRFIEIPEDET